MSHSGLTKQTKYKSHNKSEPPETELWAQRQPAMQIGSWILFLKIEHLCETEKFEV